MKKIMLLLLALTNLLIINSCQKDIEAPINTVSVTDNVVPGGSTAIISGTIECPVTITRIELYIDIAEDMPNPTKYDIETTDNAFSLNISNLDLATTYYYKYKVYTSVDEMELELEVKSFTTLATATTGIINGYDWVDLGLPSGLKWATCNVGANSPEGYGNYYAWGETTTKASYDQSNSVTYNQQISDISGNATYDAARANWGSTWRMPTYAEMQELVNNCTWTWTTQNGVNGMRVTGPNGNSIFLPAAGYCDGSSRYYVGEDGYYWSSTPYESYIYSAYDLNFDSGGHFVNRDYRYNGRTVRPVSD